MSVAKEIREEQKQALSTMNLKGKLTYFWDYYKIHTLVAVCLIIFVVSMIRQVVTNRDTALYAAFLNIVAYENETSAKWTDEFEQYAQIDTNEYQVYIDTSISLSDAIDPQLLMANEQKLATLMQTGTINVQIAETKTFEQYAQFDCFYTLEDLLSAEEIEKYRPYFYYTDAATFEPDEVAFSQDEDDISTRIDPSTLVIDHRDPSTMEQPIAVGVILTDSPMIKDSGYYTYLDDPAYDYQGHPSDVILGIPLTNQEPEMAIRFLEYLSQ